LVVKLAEQAKVLLTITKAPIYKDALIVKKYIMQTKLLFHHAKAALKITKLALYVILKPY